MAINPDDLLIFKKRADIRNETGAKIQSTSNIHSSSELPAVIPGTTSTSSGTGNTVVSSTPINALISKKQRIGFFSRIKFNAIKKEKEQKAKVPTNKPIINKPEAGQLAKIKIPSTKERIPLNKLHPHCGDVIVVE